MKTILSAVALLLAFAYGAFEHSSPNTYYYFCFSRPVVTPKAPGKQLILYTPVKKIICEPDAFAAMENTWNDKVAQLRKGQPAGTSDLNSYTTPDSATALLDVAKRYYRDTTKYTLVSSDLEK